jgi:hypothetical protein
MLEVEVGKMSRAKNKNRALEIITERKAVPRELYTISLLILSTITLYNLL